MDRRRFLAAATASAAAGWWPQLLPRAAAALEGTTLPHAGPAASDEAFWRRVRTLYSPPADYLDFDQANTSPTARPVFDAFVDRSRRLSHAPSERFTRIWVDDIDRQVRPAVATLLGTQPERIAFMLNATNALNTVIHGFPMSPGDEILVTDHEYPDMVETVLQRERREGVTHRVVRVPGPEEDPLLLVKGVRDAIGPRTKLLLISHVSAWSGEILPVAEVTSVARERGVAVLVDAAQSVGMLEVGFDRIGCDFLATSLHKWVGAPLSTGVLVMRTEHVGKVWPLHPPSWDTASHPMDLYEWCGSINMATHAAISDALTFQGTLGAERKRARMRLLGDHWQQALGAIPRVRLLTPRATNRSFGVGAFAIEGAPSADVAKHLRKNPGILVQSKAGRHSPFTNALRVSPSPIHTPAEVDRLVAAIAGLARNGLPAKG